MERVITVGEDIDITRFASGQPRTTERGPSSSAAHRQNIRIKSITYAYLCNLCYRADIQLTSNGCEKECRNCKRPFRFACLKVAGCDGSVGIRETDLCISCCEQQHGACQICGHAPEQGIPRQVLIQGPEYIKARAMLDKYVVRAKRAGVYGNWEC